MKKKTLIFGSAILILLVFAVVQRISLKKDLAPDTVSPAENAYVSFDENQEISQLSLEQALTLAIDDEYKARETYAEVIETHGDVQPFTNIIRAEEQHISSLQKLFQTYGLLVPENGWVDAITVTESISEMCAQGVQAEIENAALYREQLLPAVEAYPDVVQVFRNLMNASQNNHLPAFERCD
jgi:hypothetical protein